MNKKKAIRLWATSWLIAPTILSTQSVFSTENTVQTSENTPIAGNKMITSSDIDTSSCTTNSTEDPRNLDAEVSSVLTTHTLTLNPTLIGKVKLTVVDPTTEDSTHESQPLQISADGRCIGLKKGAKVTYVITPSKTEKLSFIEVNGAQEVDYDNNNFTIGETDVSMNVSFKTINSSMKETTVTSNTNSSKISEPENPSVPDSGKNGNTKNSSNQSNRSNNSSNSLNSINTSNSTNKPTHLEKTINNNEQSKNNNSQQTTTTTNVSEKTDIESNYVVTTPIKETLPTNETIVQQAIVKEAYKYLNAPYVWGEKGPSYFDCSGLAYYVYMKATGHYIGGWTGEQQYAGTKIPVDQAQPGDLVFWGPSTGITHHVGIYIGNGQFIHAPQPGDKVRITSIANYAPDFAVRVNLTGLSHENSSLSYSSMLDRLDQPFHFSKNQSTDQFLKKISNYAQEIGQKEGIYASVMIAQAILESGSGNSLLSSNPNYNLFGIKGSYEGKSVLFNTLEQKSDGQSYQIKTQFRKYPSYKESLEDYANLIKKGLFNNKNFYKQTWKSETKDYREATKYLEGRYATDTQYAKKLNAIIDTYNLTKYDQPKEKIKKTVTKNLINKQTTPIKWSKKDVSFATNLDFSNLKRFSESPLYFSGIRIFDVWDLWRYFLVNEIPQTTFLTVKSDTVPMLRFLSLDKTFWLELPFK